MYITYASSLFSNFKRVCKVCILNNTKGQAYIEFHYYKGLKSKLKVAIIPSGEIFCFKYKKFFVWNKFIKINNQFYIKVESDSLNKIL